MKRPEVPCPKCEGKGTRILDDVLWATLQLLAKWKDATAPEIYAKAPDKEFISPTAINVRLEELRELGLVDRTREGRVWRYFVKEKE